MPHSDDAVKTEYQQKTKDDLLAGLNPEQQAAVTHDAGPLLIVAGAGTGKTTAITKRIAWLITNGLAKSEEILALTFTEKAAGEMVERVDTLLPMGYVDLWVSTFHSFCQRLLEAHALDIGLPGDARLLNQTDAYLLVRKHFERFELDYYRPLGNPNKFIHSLLAHFSRAKDEAVTPKEYLELAKETALDKDNSAHDAEDASRLEEIANAYHTYQQMMLDEGCMDFGDLLINTIMLFRTRPAILRRYQQQFKYVIVDEFQDTNWAQYELLKMLVPKDGNIVVVGDDDQAIYKFRGASVANILQFKDDYPDAKEAVLTKNYRSKQNILDASYEFIKQNDPNRLETKLADKRKPGEPAIVKRLTAEREGNATIEHLHYASLDDEVSGVIDRIVAIRNERPECAWSDFAILVRSNSAADEFSNELQRRGIPYQFLALKGLYGKPIVLDILAYFRLLDDYHESAALYRVLSSPAYHITGTDLITLNHEARRKTESLFETLLRHSALTTLAPDTHATIERLVGDIARHT
ncbi:ATP-dependent helicase, partial [Patescibacteria group bacterium]